MDLKRPLILYSRIPAAASSAVSKSHSSKKLLHVEVNEEVEAREDVVLRAPDRLMGRASGPEPVTRIREAGVPLLTAFTASPRDLPPRRLVAADFATSRRLLVLPEPVEPSQIRPRRCLHPRRFRQPPNRRRLSSRRFLAHSHAVQCTELDRSGRVWIPRLSPQAVSGPPAYDSHDCAAGTGRGQCRRCPRSDARSANSRCNWPPACRRRRPRPRQRPSARSPRG